MSRVARVVLLSSGILGDVLILLLLLSTLAILLVFPASFYRVVVTFGLVLATAFLGTGSLRTVIGDSASHLNVAVLNIVVINLLGLGLALVLQLLGCGLLVVGNEGGVGRGMINHGHIHLGLIG